MTCSRIRLRFSAAVALCVAAFTTQHVTAQAVTNTWTSTVTGSWSTAANWDANGIPASGATTVIEFQGSTAVAAVSTNDLAANPFVVNGFNFNSTNTAGFTVASAIPFSFVNSGAFDPFINQNNTGAVTISAAITTGAQFTIGGTAVGTGALTLSGGLSLGGNLIFNSLATGTTSITGTGIAPGAFNTSVLATNLRTVTIAAIGVAAGSSVGSLGVAGTGAVTVQGVNVYAGGLTISGGTFTASVNGVTQTSLTANNATATASNGLGFGATASTVTISGTSTLNIRNRGDNTTAANTILYTNPFTLNSGAILNLSVDRDTGAAGTNKTIQFGRISLNAATINYSAANGFSAQFTGSLASPHVITGAAVVNQTTASNIRLLGGPLTFTTPATDTLTINGPGAGDFVLGNGTTTVSGPGTIILNNSRRLFVNDQAAIGNLSLNLLVANATLSTNGTNLVFPGTGTGTLTVGNGAVLNARGTATINVTIGAQTVLPTTGTIVLNNDDNVTAAITLTGNYPTLTGDMIFQNSGARNNSATIAAGTAAITGSLDLGGADRIITFNFSPTLSQSLAVQNRFTIGSLALTNTATFKGNASAVFANISGAGNLVKGTAAADTGILTVSSPIYTGTTALNFGSLRFDAAPATSSVAQAAGTNLLANFQLTPTFLALYTPAGTTGTLLIGQSTAANLDFTGKDVRIAGITNGNNAILSGTITAPSAAAGFRFGGIGPGAAVTNALSGTTNVQGVATGGGSLVIGSGLADFAATLTPVDIGSGGAATMPSYIEFAGTNTFTGNLNINANGVLTVRTAANFGAGLTNLNTGTLRVAATLTAPNPITLAGVSTIRVEPAGTVLTINGVLGGTSTLNKFGLGVLQFSTSQTVPLNFAGAVTTSPFVTGPAFTTGAVILSGPIRIQPANTGAVITVTDSNAVAGTTYTYSAGAAVQLNRNGNTSLTYTVGNAGAAANSVLLRVTNGVLPIIPAGGLAALGVTESFVVNGGVLNTTGIANGTTPIVPATIVGVNNDANQTARFLAHPSGSGGVGFTVPAITATTLSSATATQVVNAAAQTMTASGAPFAAILNGAIAQATFTLTPTPTTGGLILNEATVSAGTVAGGAELVLYVSGAYTPAAPTAGSSLISSAISGTALTVSGTGMLKLTGTNAFTGSIAIHGGILAIDGLGATDAVGPLGAIGARTIALRNGTFRIDNAASYDPSAGTKIFQIGGAGGTFDIATGGTLTLNDANQLSVGNSYLIKEGAGLLSLGAAYTGHTGVTVINGGRVALTNAFGLGGGASDANGVIVNAAGSLDFQTTANKFVSLNGGFFGTTTGTGVQNGQTVLVANSTVGGNGTFTSNGSVSGAFNLAKTGTGTTAFTGPASVANYDGQAGIWNISGPVTLQGNTSLGGNGAVNVSGVISGSFAITKPGTGITSFTGVNTYTLGTTITGGSLAIAADTGLGQAGTGVTFSGGLLRFLAASPIAAARPLVLNTAGGIDTNAFDSTITQPFTGANGTFTKAGAGTLILTAALPNPTALILTNPNVNNILDLNNQATTLSSLIIGDGTIAQTTTAVARVVNVPTLIVNGPVSIGQLLTSITANSFGELIVPNGGTLTFNAGAGRIDIGSRPNSTTNGTANGATGLVTTTTPATDAITANWTAATIELGRGNNGSSGYSAGVVNFPGGATSLVNLTATTALRVGGDSVNVVAVSSLTLSGGSNTITTPILRVGGQKTSANLTIRSGGSLTLNNGAGLPAQLIIGDNNVSTASTPISSIDFSAASGVTATLSTVSIALGNNGTGSSTATWNLGAVTAATTTGTITLATTTGTQASTGTLTISGGSLAIGGGIVGGTGSGGGLATANLNFNGGTVTLGGDIARGTGAVANRVINLALTAGTLNMAGFNIGAGVNPFNTLAFSGGTLQNVGTVFQPLTQTGGTFLRNAAGTSIVNGILAVSGAGSTVALTDAAAVLNATGGTTLATGTTLKGIGTVTGNVTVAAGGIVSPGNSPGKLSFDSSVVTLASGAIYRFEISTAGTPSALFNDGLSTNDGSSQIAVLNAGTISVDALNFRIVESGGFNGFDATMPYSWTVITVAGGATNLTFTGTPTIDTANAPLLSAALTAGGTLSLNNTSAGMINLNFVPVPEPALLLAAGMFALGAARTARRRQQQSV